MSAPSLLKMDALNVLRSITRELRYVNPKSSPRNLLAFQYLMKQYRQNQVTQEQVCRADNDMLHNAQTYLCMLRSTRECEALRAEYGRKERTVEESANLVGLQLPKSPPASDWISDINITQNEKRDYAMPHCMCAYCKVNWRDFYEELMPSLLGDLQVFL